MSTAGPSKPIRRSRRRSLTGASSGACVNCATEFSGTYCPHCGQHRDTRRLTTRELWDNIAFSFVNFDRGIPNTVRRLFWHPGEMIKEYIFGHRVTYSHPMALLLLLCTIYGIVIGLVHAGIADGAQQAAASSAILTDPQGSPLWRMAKYLFYQISNSTIFTAVLPVPAFAWVTWRMFRKYGSREYNYAEMLFMGLYMACQRVAVSIVLEPFIIIFPEADALPTLKNVIYVLLAAWCFREIFGTKWGKSIWKAILMFIVGWIALGMAIAAIFIVLIMIWVLAVVAIRLIGGGEAPEGFWHMFEDILDTL